jgi:hypothetical protein
MLGLRRSNPAIVPAARDIAKEIRMSRALRCSHNRVHVVYEDGLAAFDLPAEATLADLARVLEEAGEGQRALSVRVAVDSDCLPV